MPLKTCLLAIAVALMASAQSPVPDSAQKCTALTGVRQFPNPNTAITSADLKAASAAVTGPGGRGSIPALPAHCEVRGKMNERTGANGQHYAINFHMRLPVDWNGKFFFEGGGGSNGNIGDALGNLQGQQSNHALVLGY